MSIEKVKKFFEQYNREKDILEFNVSSATVELAAQAVGVIPARIAKTLSFKVNGDCVLIVAAGDTKIDNSKYKGEFSAKATMLSAEEVPIFTGYQIGGVCPFDNPIGTKVYCDISLKRFDTIYPACGSSNSAIQLTCDELAKYSSNIKWIDVCKGWTK